MSTREHQPSDLAAIDARLRAQDDEKQQIQAIMEARLAAMPSTFSYEDYLALCDTVGTPSGKTGHFDQGVNLFSLNALPALPRIFPEIRPVHFAATHDALEMLDPNGLSHLPQIIHGIPIEEIIGYVSCGIPLPRADAEFDRIVAADGQCTIASLYGLKALVSAHESIRPHALTKRIEPAFRKTTKGEYFYPGLAPLSYGHTIVGIPYVAKDIPMELLIDPTIAQTDRTQKYDMEVIAVPQKKVPNYLRLRYSSYPKGSVQTTVGPSM